MAAMSLLVRNEMYMHEQLTMYLLLGFSCVKLYIIYIEQNKTKEQNQTNFICIINFIIGCCTCMLGL